MNRRLKISLACLLMLVAACATFQNLAPVDKAAVVAIELTNLYEFVYLQAKDLTENGTDETKAVMLEDVNPALNKIKPVVKEYVRLAKLWKSGTLVPAGTLYEKEKQIREELELLIYTIMTVKGD